MFEQAKWIWPESESEKNQRAHFFFDVTLTSVPCKAEVLIGCETKYWLFVNGQLAVFDGGLFRESQPGCGYFDKVDVAPFLHKGQNELAVHVWYYGNGGRNNSRCDRAGLILSCRELELYSGADTLCRVDDAYYTPAGEPSNHLYGGDHTGYDARVTPFGLCPAREGAHSAAVVGCYGDKPWGELCERPVPQLFFGERIYGEVKRCGGQYRVELPYAMHFSPYIKLLAQGGEVVDLRSDRFAVNGGPGDHLRQYRGHRAEYICREGVQEFELADWLFGEAVLCTAPDAVEVLELGWRESGYDSKVTTAFTCDDPDVNRLFSKGVRTLRVCMRENYMDCPDRERGQWIGDVSVQAPQVACLLDQNGLRLLRKAICDFIGLRKGDRLVGNVPGDNFSELPSQSLNAISEWGMIASYYQATGDRSVLEIAFEPAVKYLMLWETDGEGVIVPRSGNWAWYDHLFNCDKAVLDVCWYYSALRFVSFMAKELGAHEYDDFLSARVKAIESTFDKRFWNEKGGYYSGGGFVDDRANAMAVLSGLCGKEKYQQIRYVLLSVFNSTTYMENYVLIALCEMGFKADAFRRMMCRYQPLIKNENSTLWEDFFHLGTRNHAWSGGPCTVLLRYFAGIREDLTRVSVEDISPLKEISVSFVNREGERESFTLTSQK